MPGHTLETGLSQAGQQQEVQAGEGTETADTTKVVVAKKIELPLGVVADAIMGVMERRRGRNPTLKIVRRSI